MAGPIRRADRKTNRDDVSSPYRRSALKPAKSADRTTAWSVTTFLRSLIPFGRAEPTEPASSYEDLEASPPSPQSQEPASDTPASASASAASDLQHDEYPHPPERDAPVPQNSALANSSRSIPSPPPSSAHAPAPAISTLPFPLTSSSLPTLPPSGSPSQNIEAVRRYLHSRDADKLLDPVELAGLVTLLNQSAAPKPEDPPFRFSTSPAPSRDTTPLPASTSTLRQLATNPNGPLRATGAGSARRVRNRFQSPAFGPPRPPLTQGRLRLSPPRPSKTDAKRRRVDEESTYERAGESESERVNVNGTASVNGNANANASSALRANGSTVAPQVPATPRPRHARIPATPVNPSPLRNGWGRVDSSSPSVNGSPAKSNGHGTPTKLATSTPTKSTANSPAKVAGSSPVKSMTNSPTKSSISTLTKKADTTPTKAATIMADLIRQTAPPKKPDVANPYQAALPARVQVPVKKKRKVEERKKEEEEAKKEKERKGKEKEGEERRQNEEVSAQRIIEATLPKGSRRSRPPAHMQKITAPPAAPPAAPAEPRRSARLRSPEIIRPPRPPRPFVTEVEDIDDSPPKKQKTTLAPTKPTPTTAPIFPTSSSAPSSLSSASPASTTTFPSSTSAPSVIIEEVSPPAPSAPATRPAEVIEPSDGSAPLQSQPQPGMRAKFGARPREPSKLRFGFAADAAAEDEKDGASTDRAAVSTPKPFDAMPKLTATSAPPPATSIPKSASSTTTATASGSTDPKTAALALAPSALPTFAFDAAVASSSSSKSPPAHAKAYEAAKAVPQADLPVFAFVVNVAVTMENGAKGSWLNSSSKMNGDISTNGRAKDTPKGFDWTAAGMAKPAAPATESWTCGMCMISNTADKMKCAACEEPRPANAAPKPSTGGFNWAAAGMKKPEVTSATGEWTCGTCMLKNPDSKSICGVCEAKRP